MNIQFPKIYIIILNWNGWQDTLECLESIEKIYYCNYKVLVIDNGSTNKSVIKIKYRYPKIELIITGKNLGFVGGNNIGIKRALKSGAKYVLLLNNDTVVDQRLLEYLLEPIRKESKVGIVGAVNYYFDYPEKIWYSGGIVNWWRGKIIELTKLDKDCRYFNMIKEVDDVAGSCMLIKRDVIEKIGFLDQKFFCSFDETEYCFRAKKAGYKIVVNFKAMIWHKVARTMTRGGTKPHIGIYFHARNRFLFLRKHCPRLYLMPSFIGSLGEVLCTIIIYLLKHKFTEVKFICFGVYDFIRGKFGKGSADDLY